MKEGVKNIHEQPEEQENQKILSYFSFDISNC